MRGTIGVMIGVALAVAVSPAAAQATAPETTALLQEVRLLRQAIETLAGTNARVQIVFGRLQIQEQRTASALSRLDTVREQLSKVTGQIAIRSERLKQLEEMEPGREPAEQESIAAQLRQSRYELRDLEGQRGKLALDESDAANRLALEQGQWSELNRTLDDLERALTPRPKQ